MSSQSDIDHVVKALQHLNPGGILVSVMSAGVKFRQDKRTLAFKNKIGTYEHEIIDLPPGAFKVSGTGVNTIILRVRN